MNLIDAPTNTRLTLAQVNRLPRIAGRTQITAKTCDEALADNQLAREPETERPGPDYDQAPPQIVDGVVQPQQWIQREITPEQIATHRASVLQQIDVTVDDWRVALTAPGSFVTAEYELKRSDAAEYINAHGADPDAPVPAMIQAVADRYGIPATDAAALILSRASDLPDALRASAVIRDEQKGLAENADDIPAIDQALADTHARLAQLT